MSLPRLHAELVEGHAVARVLRSALRHERATVRLSAPPQSRGEHLLEVEVPGEGRVIVLADVVSATPAGHVLQLRPVSRRQMPDLLAVVERLVEPSFSEPPAAYREPPPEPSGAWESEAGASDDETICDEPDGSGDRSSSVVPALFGVIDSALPAPPSSGSVMPRPGTPLFIPAPPRTPAGFVERPVERSVRGSPLIGRVIAGKYEVQALIGEGMTAAVYRAMHLDLKRHVAVKILHEHTRADDQFVKRFKAEAQAASRLEHANIVRVVDFGQDTEDRLLYLVMELLVGRSLETMLKTDGRLTQQKAVAVTIEACTALAYAHDNGLIHRDVKPENLMLVAHRDDDGNPCDLVKVCDFGLAKLRDPAPEQEDLTTAGTLCGSPAYMSPEQVRGERLDPRTDVYSLGVTLFEAVTGELPHQAEGLAQFFLKKMAEPPRRPSSIVADIDPLLEDVLLRAIATDRAERHANARVLREELREVLASLAAPSDERESTIVAD